MTQVTKSKNTARSLGHAFTLIELLIVIAILAILAAILFPVFAQARAKDRETACLTDEKQIMNAALQYLPDYDGRWVDNWNGYAQGIGQGATMATRWLPMQNPIGIGAASAAQDYLLKPYIKNDGALHCPEQKAVKSGSVNWLLPQYAMNVLPSRPYVFYPLVTPDCNEDSGVWCLVGAEGRLEAQISQTASLIFLLESNEPEPHCVTWFNNPKHGSDWSAPHTGGLNLGFADGHAKRFLRSRLTNQMVCYWDLPMNWQ